MFTKLDLKWGYNNVRIKEDNEWKVAREFVRPKYINVGLYTPM